MCGDADVATETPLNDQQRLFAKHYATLNNAAEAARKAGYSPKNVRETGSRLSRDPRVLALCSELAESLERTKVRAELIDEARLEAELEHAATLDPRTIFDDDGRLLDPLLIPESTARAIASMKVVQRDDGKARLVDIKFMDKANAIKLLGQQKGMFVERREYTHKLQDLTTAELEAELSRIEGEHGNIRQSAEDHGVRLN